MCVCLRRFDSDAMFSQLLSGGTTDVGFFSIDIDDFSHSEQHYERNTAILVTTLYTKCGSALEITVYINHIAPSYHIS